MDQTFTEELIDDYQNEIKWYVMQRIMWPERNAVLPTIKQIPSGNNQQIKKAQLFGVMAAIKATDSHSMAKFVMTFIDVDED